jgi:uncharacterized protein YigA (DUF484 family)
MFTPITFPFDTNDLSLRSNTTTYSSSHKASFGDRNHETRHAPTSAFTADTMQDQSIIALLDKVIWAQQQADAFSQKITMLEQTVHESINFIDAMGNVSKTFMKCFNLDLAAIILRDDHPIAFKYGNSTIPGLFFVNNDIIASALSEGWTSDFFQKSPFNSPDISEIRSSILTPLVLYDRIVGFFCLGSYDPERFKQNTNGELIKKIGQNLFENVYRLWEHEEALRLAIVTENDDFYTEAFMFEFIKKQFHKSWRTQDNFALLAISVSADKEQISSLTRDIVANVRAADVCARGSDVSCWVFLSDVDVHIAKTIATRIKGTIEKGFKPGIHVNFGIAGFSKNAYAHSCIINKAQEALAAALGSNEDIVIQP